MSWQFGVGVGISLFSTTISNIGMNMQKFSHIKNEEQPEEKQLGSCKRPFWVLGLIIFILGNSGAFFAFSFAPQSVIAPLGSWSLVCNLVIAPMFLKEKLTFPDILSTALIVIGMTLVIVFGKQQETAYTTGDLLSFYSRSGTIAYLTISGFLIVMLFVVRFYCDRIFRVHEENVKRGIEGHSHHERCLQLYPYIFPVQGGLVGAITVLTGKASGELLKTSVAGDNQLIYWQSWLLMIAYAVTSIAQVVLLNQALKHSDSMFAWPVFFCVSAIFTVIGGALYFEELYSFSAVQYAMFFFGLSLLICGVIVLAKRLTPEQLPKWCVPHNWWRHCSLCHLLCNLRKFGIVTKDEKMERRIKKLEKKAAIIAQNERSPRSDEEEFRTLPPAKLKSSLKALQKVVEQQVLNEVQEISLRSHRTPLRAVPVSLEEITIVT